MRATVCALFLACLGTACVRSNVPQSPPDLHDGETVQLFYYSPDKDTDDAGNVMCSRQGLVAVERKVDSRDIDATIRLLLEGNLTERERAAGITTEFPLPGLALESTRLEEGTLTLTFSDPQNQTVGGACRISVLWYQIEATAKQFPEVREVRFEPETLFQP